MVKTSKSPLKKFPKDGINFAGTDRSIVTMQESVAIDE